MLTTKVIWFIDEDARDLRTYTASLRLAISSATVENILEIRPLLAKANQEDYLVEFNNANTVSIIIDQRLKEAGTVNYTGIELAKYIRTTYPKLPIYILTAFADDQEAFEGNEGNVESIFSKDLLNGSKDKSNQIVQRLLRHIDIHETIIEQREARFVELLEMSFSGALSAEDQQELMTLRQDRTIGILAEELGTVGKMTAKLDELENLSRRIANLQRKTSENDDDNTPSELS